MRNQEIVHDSGKAPIWEASYHLASEDEVRSLYSPKPEHEQGDVLFKGDDSIGRWHTRGPVAIDPDQLLQASGDGCGSSWHKPI
eukprot:13578371-Ditylum_brightwellii.AAC.1